MYDMPPTAMNNDEATSPWVEIPEVWVLVSGQFEVNSQDRSKAPASFTWLARREIHWFQGGFNRNIAELFIV